MRGCPVGRTSEATVGVNTCPRSQRVLTCSTGPWVDGNVHWSMISAWAPQATSGQAML
jgi:hypothetical protein